jgi:hypothetical protein
MTSLVLSLALLLLSAPNQGDGAKPADSAKSAADAAIIAKQLPSYPLSICPISDEPLDVNGEPLDVLVQGRLVRTCCKSCVKVLAKDPSAVFAAIDQAVIEQQKPSYPLTTSPVSGKELGAAPFDHVVGTRLVRLASKEELAGFEKDPSKYMALVDQALIDAQKAAYPHKVCPISGEALGSMGDPCDVLYGTRLVRLCCKGCLKKFEKDPAAAVAKLAAPPPSEPKKS